MPPSLRPQYTSIEYTGDIGAQFNNTFTLPPTDVTFPAKVVKRPVHNHEWNFWQRERCTPADLHKYIFPYGDFEAQLLNIRPPTRTQELCQKLPDLDNPSHSYTQLQKFIQNRTATNYTWYSWASTYTNETQQSISLQQLTGNLTMDNLTQEYHKFTPTPTHYLRKLQTAQIDEMFATTKIHILRGHLFRYSEENLTVSNTQQTLQIAENTKFFNQQFIQ